MERAKKKIYRRRYNFATSRRFYATRGLRRFKKSLKSNQINNGFIRARLDNYLNIYSRTDVSLTKYSFTSGSWITGFTLTGLLTNSPDWSYYSTGYQRYKITGLLCEFERVSPTTTSTFTDNLSPPLIIAFFTTGTSTTVVSNNDVISANDSFKPVVQSTNKMRKYWPIPENSLQFSDGCGLGTWNAISKVASQCGLLSIGCPQTTGVFASSDKVMYSLLISIYIQFIEAN